MDYVTSVNAFIYDEARADKFDAIVEDRDEKKSEVIRQLIDEEYERSDVDIEDLEENEEETSLPERYDPDADYSLRKDDIKELAGEVDEINPLHVKIGEMPSGKDAVLSVMAMAEYEGKTSAVAVTEICEQVGLDSDYYLDTIPEKVVRRMRQEHRRQEQKNQSKLSNEEKIVFGVNACMGNMDNVGDNIRRVRKMYKSIDDEERYKEYGRMDIQCDEIVSEALYKLKKDADSLTGDVDVFESPTDLVDWYSTENDEGWMNDKSLQLVKKELNEWVEVASEMEEKDE
jgi:hypothetical protein